ncbi:hypothetical protein SDC9_67013 [bioreactor metagenome]|uniref:Uncharacterized protein n=1 Tax=bioreactor metagenome TaxID=1076179 RepID=A0A644XWG4_9ZZZZ
MGLYDMFNNGQTQPCATVFTAAAFVGAEKPFENPGQVFLLDADAVVGHFNQIVFIHIESLDGC